VATDLPVVLPLHPRTQAASLEAGLQRVLPSSVRLLGPVGYLDMLALEQAAALVATDSGGVQKEAYFAGVPCVTLRQETEWTELVELGWNRVCPPTSGRVMAREIKAALGTTGRRADLYGSGQASVRIARRLMSSVRA
jgi:UDP-GlcNAc3NAcA epimerase